MKKIVSSFAILMFTRSVLLIISNECMAQNLDFKRFAVPGGISMGLVRCLTIDEQGYIWFGGVGIFRYDGYQVKAYKNDPLNPNSLGSNTIESIWAGKNGIIWIGTKGYGLDRFDPAKSTFTHFRMPQLIHNKVSALFEDRDGILWVGTHGGLDRFDAATGLFIHYTQPVISN